MIRIVATIAVTLFALGLEAFLVHRARRKAARLKPASLWIRGVAHESFTFSTPTPREKFRAAAELAEGEATLGDLP